MFYIKGKFKQSIFETNSGYKVGLFRVNETNHEEIEVNSTITFTGYFAELESDVTYEFNGDYVIHDRYGHQFVVSSYKKQEPEEKDAILEFLTSGFVKGCGVKTAKSIINIFGKNTLTKIKENKSNLLLVPGIGEKTANSIYTSVMKYYEVDDHIVYLQELGFTIKETMRLINAHEKRVKSIINDNIYLLNEIIDFPKLDEIFLKNNNKEDIRRVEACIIEAMKKLTFAGGDTYLDKIDIVMYLSKYYHIYINIDSVLEYLCLNKKIVNENEDYYLIEDYLAESYNAECIKKLTKNSNTKIELFDKYVKEISKESQIVYNNEQINAIYNALTNDISIITGGPGTGKTTIIRGIIKIYSKMNDLNEELLDKNILLLAPTGRAAKRMSETTGLNASTIHRFLKWDKDNNTFAVNEYNKEKYNLIIIDEVSMLDNRLLSSLFKGIRLNTKIVFVGDEYQLPSVGPGLVLSDMINSEVITHIRLNNIYRQSENSFIPILAKEIKDAKLSEEVYIKKDDYNFIETSSNNVKNVMKKAIEKALEKDIDQSKIQVLAPMYKGENGIDNLNILLQSIFNPLKHQRQLNYFDVNYREGDKVLNLVNDVELNIYNGDIGIIKEVNTYDKDRLLVIDYDTNMVTYKRDDISNITHAYAISIHKSQGSEFEHVIMPITFGYSKMLYNKLMYTGVSRAKKSLILIGDTDALESAVKNNYSEIRKTSLKRKILNNL